MTVFMFHSIGLEKSNWRLNYLSIPIIHFEKWFQYLERHKYKTTFLEEWYNDCDTIANGKDKRLVLTFDDGYLDNWVYLFPLLEKYQIRATIFINPEFIDPSKNRRPNLADYRKNQIKESELMPKGFLNWNEILYMHQSGLVDIQSHSMSHDWFFSSNSLIDTYQKENYQKYYWLSWFLNKNTKPFYMSEDQSNTIPENYPVFTFGRSLAIRRYFPNIDFVEYLTNSELSQNILNDKGKLFRLNNKLLDSKYMGTMETDSEQSERYIYELEQSKKIIESRLNKKVDYLCWPGGGYNNSSVAISEKVGYKASTIASWERNQSAKNERSYKRIPRHSLGTTINYKGKIVIDNNPKALTNIFMEFEGNRLKKMERYIKKIYLIALK